MEEGGHERNIKERKVYNHQPLDHRLCLFELVVDESLGRWLYKELLVALGAIYHLAQKEIIKVFLSIACCFTACLVKFLAEYYRSEVNV